MTINIRTKGQSAEREVAKMLNTIILDVMKQLGFGQERIEATKTMVQRNQNQSAVGGNDLSNTFGLSIEVKRQEQLSVNTWWNQTVEAAERNQDLPILMYRQNRKAWRVVTLLWLSNGDGSHQMVRAEIDIDTFKAWFARWVKAKFESGYEVRT